MSVRVQAGRQRGQRLRVPAGGRTRPTGSLVRGAMFDMVAARGWLGDARILDLFAGSGALGIEALSRGAAEVVFVEDSPGAIRVLRANLATSGVREQATVLPLPADRALKRLERDAVRVHGVFADPPYGRGWVRRTLDWLAHGDVLEVGGWIAIEHDARETPPAVPRLTMVAERRHGQTSVSVLVKEGSRE